MYCVEIDAGVNWEFDCENAFLFGGTRSGPIKTYIWARRKLFKYNGFISILMKDIKYLLFDYIDWQQIGKK
jgi:hypothetical protein